MAQKEELKSVLKNIPYVQKMFLATLSDVAENNEDKDELFSSQSFRELLASNLFFILTSRTDYNPDSQKDIKNMKFLSSYIWTMIKTTPIPLLVSLVLSNIEFGFDVELSDFHNVFGRDLKLQNKPEQSAKIFLKIPIGNKPC